MTPSPPGGPGPAPDRRLGPAPERQPGPAPERRLDPATRDATIRWVADDPDPATAAELRELLAAAMARTPGAVEALDERMAGPLRFGTAGLRAPVRAGPAGMNVAVVRRATAGLASWLSSAPSSAPPSAPPSATPPAPPSATPGGLVVVGRDSRHGSRDFARATAQVLAAAGFTVRLLAEPLPTPLVAYAVRTWSAVAGVQITASHNPPADNGYKVFLGGPGQGAQLVEPADRRIEAAIAAAPPARAVPVEPVEETDPAPLLEDYLTRVAALPRGRARALRIALTPLHGVGGAVAVHALRRAGFDDVHVVRSQAAPDPDFPTVTFPNPQEPGATDELLALAAEVGADLAVALDPDADRCALGVPVDPRHPRDPSGWRMLTGDQTGVLLGDHVLATLDRVAHPDPLVATTVASSTSLRAVATARGARYAETLTGFKWIVRAGDGGSGLVYGYEEALGYCVDPDAVRDKDGISAAVLAADLAATRRAAGGSLLDALDELDRAHGVHLTGAVTVGMSAERRSAVVARLAGSDPPGFAVSRPAADVLVLVEGRSRAVIRPSGTEPKLKAYLEVVTAPPESPDAPLDAVRAEATAGLARLRERITGLLEPG